MKLVAVQIIGLIKATPVTVVIIGDGQEIANGLITRLLSSQGNILYLWRITGVISDIGNDRPLIRSSTLELVIGDKDFFAYLKGVLGVNADDLAAPHEQGKYRRNQDDESKMGLSFVHMRGETSDPTEREFRVAMAF